MKFQPKNILVPTDFSRPAYSAFKYAMGLAKMSGGIVSLVHAYRLIMRDTNQAQDFRSQLKKTIDQKFKLLRHDALDLGFTDINMVSYIGFPKDAIMEIIETQDVDMIVMGTSGLTEPKKLLGGTIRDVARNVKTPILAIPEGTTHSNPIKVAREAHALMSNSIQNKLLDYITEDSSSQKNHKDTIEQKSALHHKYNTLGDTSDIVPLTPLEYDQIYKSHYNKYDTLKPGQLKPLLIEHHL